MIAPLGMAAIAISLAVLFVVAVARVAPSARRGRYVAAALLGVVAWLGLFALLAARGLLAAWDRRPPPVMLGMVATIILVGLVFRSRLGHALSEQLPVAALIGLQAFRLPLELVMHEAARAGIMPVQMSFSGWNFDIVTGITAIPVAWLAATQRAPRWLLLAWNALGSILLLTIMIIAIASTPVIAAFGRGPAENTFVAHVPYVWLPTVMVATALLGHFLLWRKLVGSATVASS